ncbi:hypothetical protein KFE25_009501 [Diacronema lutheri]|uniref:Biogenesis of lysosome-related organelles complex 1 subunit 2 n=1 Tax=Diacronema lutheri TaxID=2081491 RepID=A0A8J6CI80_DIALT|nr:hypothetical protein KFE25_009501 [Diacronema lutheri]|mmetsp:Transcript_4355/g.13447  ORF Transcript_4355/g.13447 Transcript_4355/m.13447 type:complete len:109 (-) Transcript_4355:419-745(-)
MEDGVRETVGTLSDRLVDYLSSEAAVSAESSRCLRDMNLIAAQRYRAAADGVAELNASTEAISARHAAVHPLLLQVGDIEAHVAELERVVTQLNEYTKRLEHRYRALA